MEEALRFLKENEIFIYLFLGVFSAWQLWKFSQAWSELRDAAFGLEREKAQGRLNRAASLIVFFLLLGALEFATVAYVVPTFPEASPIFTPTLDLLATATATLATPEPEEPTMTPAPQISTLNASASGCIEDQVFIRYPANGDSVRDLVEIIGTANIGNFGFYKYEIAGANESTWLTVAAGNEMVNNAKLGDWDTTRLVPGDYQLRLVVADNDGAPAGVCVVQVRVEAPTGE